MPKPKDPDEGHEERGRRERGEQGRQEHDRRGGEDDRYGDGDKDRPRRRRMGREHAVHQQIVERRLSGGAPATPEAYAKALEEWQQLPGSIVRPPTDQKPSEKDNPVKRKDAKEE
jgi:hypothetical protein